MFLHKAKSLLNYSQKRSSEARIVKEEAVQAGDCQNVVLGVPGALQDFFIKVIAATKRLVIILRQFFNRVLFVESELELEILLTLGVHHVEVAVEHPGHEEI